MSNSAREQPGNQENARVWQAIFRDGEPKLQSLQRFHRRLPSAPRCSLCYAPFAGIGGAYMRLRGKGRNRRNPRYCNACDKYLQTYPGGAEVELSMMFADIRNFVSKAERMPAAEVSKQLSSFYAAVTRALVESDGFILELRGDCVFGVYPPGFCGAEHARKAVEAAQHLLADIPPRAPDGSLLPIGIGVHTGTVFVCTVAGADGAIQEIGMHGDATNVAARLSQAAQAGQVLISDAAYRASELNLSNAQPQQLELKGKSEPIGAWALRAAA